MQMPFLEEGYRGLSAWNFTEKKSPNTSRHGNEVAYL